MTVSPARQADKRFERFSTVARRGGAKLPAMKTNPILGVALVLAAAALWGTTGTAQSLGSGGLQATWFGALRLGVAAVFFTTWAALRPAAVATPLPLPRRELLGAGLCMAIYNLAFFAGIRITGVALGTAIALGSGPLWAGLLQALLQRHRLGAGWWVGTLLTVAGGSLMALGSTAVQGSAGGFGLGLCLLAGLSYAVYTLLNQRLAAAAPALAITLPAFSIAALVALPLALADAGWPRLALIDMAAVAYAGAVTAGVAYLLFSNALRHIGSATAVTLALFEPVVAFVLAIVLVGEAASVTSSAGLALVIVGVLVVVRQELAAVPARPCRAPGAVEPARRRSISAGRTPGC